MLRGYAQQIGDQLTACAGIESRLHVLLVECQLQFSETVGLVVEHRARSGIDERSAAPPRQHLGVHVGCSAPINLATGRRSCAVEREYVYLLGRQRQPITGVAGLDQISGTELLAELRDVKSQSSQAGIGRLATPQVLEQPVSG